MAPVKNSFYILLFLSLYLPVTGQTGMGTPRDAIKEVIKEAYVDGIYNEGNLRNVELGFSPAFEMKQIENNAVKTIPLSQIIAQVKSQQEQKAFPPAATEMVRVDYLSIDVEDDIAVVKLRFYRGNKLAAIDFITLFHFEEGWKLVSKVYKMEPETKN